MHAKRLERERDEVSVSNYQYLNGGRLRLNYWGDETRPLPEHQRTLSHRLQKLPPAAGPVNEVFFQAGPFAPPDKRH